MTESYTNHSVLYKYYLNGAEIPTNFQFMEDLNDTPKGFEDEIESWITTMPSGSTFNSVVFHIIKYNILY